MFVARAAHAEPVPPALLKGHKGTLSCLVFAPDGKALASGAKDGTVIVWDVAARKPLVPVPGHKDTVVAVALAPDGKTLATGGIDRNVARWDFARLRADHPKK